MPEQSPIISNYFSSGARAEPYTSKLFFFRCPGKTKRCPGMPTPGYATNNRYSELDWPLGFYRIRRGPLVKSVVLDSESFQTFKFALVRLWYLVIYTSFKSYIVISLPPLAISGLNFKKNFKNPKRCNSWTDAYFSMKFEICRWNSI